MIELVMAPHHRNHEPGTWKSLRQDRIRLDNGNTRTIKIRSASFTCPRCEKPCALLAHQIKRDGRVVPTVRCPTPGCTFEGMVKLLNW